MQCCLKTFVPEHKVYRMKVNEQKLTFYSVNEIRSKIFEIQRFENLSCLALFILTHGEENGLLFGRDTNYRLNRDIVQELLPKQCPGLAGKPKMIFVQVSANDESLFIFHKGFYFISSIKSFSESLIFMSRC